MAALAAAEGRRPLVAAAFAADPAVGDGIRRLRCGRWVLERVWPGENVVALNLETTLVQVALGEGRGGCDRDGPRADAGEGI